MSREKKLVFLAACGGIVGMLGLAYLLLVRPPWKQHEPRIDFPPQNSSRVLVQPADDSAPQLSGRAAVQESVKPQPTSDSRLRSLGDIYGHEANWRKAWDCYRVVAWPGNRSESDWSCATASALAAGETKSSEDLCRLVLEHFGSKGDQNIAERCAKQCLVLPGVSGDLLEQGVQLANYCLLIGPSNPWRYLAKGMAEYRLGNWAEALRWLQRPADDSAMELSALAWGFIAMTRHKAGDSASALKALDEVNRRFNVMTKTGVLGSYGPTWDNCARAVAVRAEAERLIKGKEVSPPLQAAALATGKRSWQTLLKMKDSAEQLAKRGRWFEASLAYVQIMEHPAFDWEVFELKQSLLFAEMPVVFIQARDETRYTKLIEAYLARDPQNIGKLMRIRYSKAVLIGGEQVPQEFRTKAVALARLACSIPEAEKDPWLWLLRGMTDYREGKYADAIESLNHVKIPYNRAAEATAVAFRAMALKHLGRAAEAVQTSIKAASSFAGTGTITDWISVVSYQLVLKELTDVMGLPSDIEQKK